MGRPLRALLFAIGAALLLAACATPVGAPDKVAANAAPRAAARFALEVDAESSLRSLLLAHLDLARLQRSADAQGLSLLELDRLAAAAPAQARGLLETEGYFNPQISLSREGRPDTGSEGDTPVQPGTESLHMKVEPGPRSQVASVAFQWRGDLGTAANTEAGTGLPAATLRARVMASWPLREGSAFTQAAWSAAKSEALTLVRAQGYPLARWSETAARVNADENNVVLALELDSGPLFRLGAVKVEGLAAHPESTVQRLAGFTPGQAYSEQLLLDYQERLQKTLLFDSVSVELQTDAAQAGAAVVWVRIKEGPLQQATTGIGYHANTGQRVTLEHVHRQPFGLPMRSQVKLDLGRDLRAAQVDLSSYPQEDMQRNLASMKIEQDSSSDPITTSLTGRIGRLRETAQQETLYFGEAVRSREVRAASTVTSGAASLNAQWTWRQLDSALLPTQGYTASLLVGAGRADSSAAQSGAFGRAQLKLAWYQPFAAHWYASARTETSQVLSSDRVGIPDELLFRAGGDDSVRGYAYRSLSPIVNGNAVGGRVLWTGSVELARPLNLSRPDLWGAAFIDAGQAAAGWRDWHAAVGYGLGLRWRSPVGPLRVDLARGIDVHRWRVHFSVGIAL